MNDENGYLISNIINIVSFTKSSRNKKQNCLLHYFPNIAHVLRT